MTEKKLPRLTPRQERFVALYLVSQNATDAVRRAGYAPKHADKEGWRVLNLPQVAAALEVEREKLRNQYRVTADRVLEGLAKVAFAPEGTEKTADRVKALELLGRRFGSFVDRTEITVNGGPLTTISADATPEQAIEAYSKLLQ